MSCVRRLLLDVGEASCVARGAGYRADGRVVDHRAGIDASGFVA